MLFFITELIHSLGTDHWLVQNICERNISVVYKSFLVSSSWSKLQFGIWTQWICYNKYISTQLIGKHYSVNHNFLNPFNTFFQQIVKQESCSVSRYASFHETAKADAVLGYLIAFLVLLATIKLWHLLRLNPKLHMITATLQRAWADISGFLVVMTIMFLAYSIAVSSFPQFNISMLLESFFSNGYMLHQHRH